MASTDELLRPHQDHRLSLHTATLRLTWLARLSGVLTGVGGAFFAMSAKSPWSFLVAAVLGATLYVAGDFAHAVGEALDAILYRNPRRAARPPAQPGPAQDDASV